jgi:hypothetical protein
MDQAKAVQAIEVSHKSAALMQTNDPDSIIRYALDKGNVDVGTMERLLTMRKELQSEYAKKQFDEQMKEFQSECPVITKEKAVPDRSGNIAYKFAPIEVIEVQIRPLLRKRGFSHTFDTDTASIPGWVIAKCIVKHEAGHSEISTVKLPLGTKTAIMSDTQTYAAAYTFANRRALCNAYGLIVAGEDMDGQTGKLKPAGPSKLKADNVSLEPLQKKLWTLLSPIRGLEKNYNQANKWLHENEFIGEMEDMPNDITAERYVQVIEQCEKFFKTNPLGVK